MPRSAARAAHFQDECATYRSLVRINSVLMEVVKRVQSNTTRFEPSEDTTKEDIEFYSLRVDFFEALKYEDSALVVEDQPRTSRVRSTINGSNSIQRRIETDLKKKPKDLKLKDNKGNEITDILSKFAQGVTSAKDLRDQIRDLKSRIKRLNKKGNESKVEDYLNAVARLRNINLTLAMTKRRLNTHIKDAEDLAERFRDVSINPFSDQAGRTLVINYFVLANKTYTLFQTNATEARDTIIDIYRSVDREDQSKVIHDGYEMEAMKAMRKLLGTDIVMRSKKQLNIVMSKYKLGFDFTKEQVRNSETPRQDYY